MRWAHCLGWLNDCRIHAFFAITKLIVFKLFKCRLCSDFERFACKVVGKMICFFLHGYLLHAIPYSWYRPLNSECMGKISLSSRQHMPTMIWSSIWLYIVWYFALFLLCLFSMSFKLTLNGKFVWSCPAIASIEFTPTSALLNLQPLTLTTKPWNASPQCHDHSIDSSYNRTQNWFLAQ